MNIFLWHVHGSWTTAFVQGRHRYYVPVVPGRGPDGRGRAETWDWPASVTEVDRAGAATVGADVVVLQRPHEVEHMVAEWLGGRRPGVDIPAVYVEHNTPAGGAVTTRHLLADRREIPLVHVTHFNQLFWDSGAAPTVVIEHGVVDPGYRYTGELPRAAVVINEPVRRTRVAGTDLLDRFRAVAPVDVYGMETSVIGGIEDLPQEKLHTELPRRRVYVHPFRWTSLGLSLIEAMHLGMPVVALAATEAVEAVPREAGVCSTDVDALVRAVERYLADPDAANAAGRFGRSHAQRRYGLFRFLAEWDTLLEEVTR
jgi:Glycosyl transferases group 1